MSVDGLTAVPSDFSAKETADRLEAAVKQKGMTVFARIDHAAGAAAEGMSLNPVELLIFGSAKAGTPLMQAEPSVGIDLPLKVLVYEDAAGNVWASYNQPGWIAQRHDLKSRASLIVDSMATTLATVVNAASRQSTL